MPSVVIIMSDYGHDPTGEFDYSLKSMWLIPWANLSVLETAVPYACFRQAGFEVAFATQTGKGPVCDQLMLKGWTQKLLVFTAFKPVESMQRSYR
jgi:hypothetical protein